MSDRPNLSRNLADRVHSIEQDVEAIKRRMETGEQKFDDLEKMIQDGTNATKELVAAWQAADGVVKLVKWVGALAAGALALWIAFRDVFIR